MTWVFQHTTCFSTSQYCVLFYWEYILYNAFTSQHVDFNNYKDTCACNYIAFNDSFKTANLLFRVLVLLRSKYFKIILEQTELN